MNFYEIEISTLLIMYLQLKNLFVQDSAHRYRIYEKFRIYIIRSWIDIIVLLRGMFVERTNITRRILRENFFRFFKYIAHNYAY